MPAVYLFRCRLCENRTSSFEQTTGACGRCGMDSMIRDYRAEGVAPAIANLRRENGGQDLNWFKQNFLPTASEFAGPGDPDGSKGLTKWNDEHGPKDSNKAPARPEVPKRVF